MSPIKRIESESAKTSGDKTRRHTDVKVEQQDILAKQQEIDSAIDADDFSAVKQFKLERLVLEKRLEQRVQQELVFLDCELGFLDGELGLDDLALSGTCERPAVVQQPAIGANIRQQLSACKERRGKQTYMSQSRVVNA